jgi:hypothetical protein
MILGGFELQQWTGMISLAGFETSDNDCRANVMTEATAK